MRTYSHKAMDTEFRVSFGEREDAALCASAKPNGYLERVEAAPELQAELEPQKLIDVVVAFVRWFLRPLRGLATFPQRTWLGYEAW